VNKIKIYFQRITIGIALVIFSCGMLYSFTILQNEKKPEIITSTDLNEGSQEWSINKEINTEFIGSLKFENGLIEENIVQTKDNEKYLALSWDLKESSHGAAFMDYRNSQDDQNMIIYAHYVYKDESLMFGPLHQLIQQENYEENSVIHLQLENEIRKYKVAYVYYYEMDNPTLEYFHTNYDKDYFDFYLESIKNKAFYDTGLEITKNDKLLTLQTCVRDREDLRLIVVAKEIS
jgi:sortase B